MATNAPELPKNYDPAAVEPEVYKTWLDESAFTADPNAAGEPYSIVIPPPNVTGALHLGHAINNTLQDILTRRSRMQGKNTLWVPGIDHAGIATQAVVEKQLKEKENKTRHDVGREGLVERIWAWKQQYGDRILMQLQRMGCSCDWSRTRFTLDDMCARAVRETFFKLFKDGLIYRGKRLVNWDTHLLTSISDDELYTETVKTNLWHIKYPIEGTDKSMTIATTRPETMLADTAVAVHPDDPRWNWAIGKFVKLPLTNRLIPIIADPVLVDMAFGSGAVKVTPAHDPNDYAVWQRQAGKIEILNLMTPEGKVNDADPSWVAYIGMTFAVARKKIVEDLITQGFMTEEDIKPHEANVNFSDRSKTAIQPYLSDQWFVKMAPLAEPALEVVRNGTIKFFPERHAQQYLSWLGEKRDWPISRQLWWGHRIPVWTKTIESNDLQEFHVIDQLTTEPLEDLLIDQGQREALVIIDAETGERLRPDLGQFNHGLKRRAHLFLCLADDTRAADWERNGWTRDPDVLDTWFSSALWPHSTLGWPEQTVHLAKYYPTNVLMTGRDIITLWVARMVMTGLYNMGQIPFHHVAINPTILDGKGERMSKSKGNGVDPVDVIETHGADALRFTLSTMATETQDVRMPVKKLADGRNTSDKFDLGRNFCNKLWNASKFAFANLSAIAVEPVDETKWSLADRWIVSRFNRTVAEANDAIGNYRFDQYAKSCYDFFSRDFCDWYLEAAKPALKDPARAGQAANILAACLDGALRLMHPMIPFITERLWWALNDVRSQRGLPKRLECPGAADARLVKAAWPNVGEFAEAAEHIFPRLQGIIGEIRNLRNEHKVDQKKAVTVSIAPPGEEAVRATNDNREMIETLAVCTIKEIKSGLPQPPNSTRSTANGNCDIYVEGLVDENAEQARLAKREEELEKMIATMQGRLGNEGYIAKARPKLVEQTKAQLAEAIEELAKLKKR